MRELKIEPQFRDLIPKLTDEEFKQLEKNILKDGKVNQPIVVWNDVIVDGHHRYYVVQKHPEIPFEVEEKNFPNEYAAMAWACNEQLGRRNLNPRDRAYLIGKQYESEKKSVGGNGSNQHKVSNVEATATLQNCNERTRERIAKENNTSSRTVSKDQNFAQGIDIAENIIPGMKDKLLHDNDTPVPMDVVSALPRVSKESQEKAVKAMFKKDTDAARSAFKDEGVLTEFDRKKNKKEKSKAQEFSMSEEKESEPYNTDDLLEEIRCAKENLHFTLNQTLIVMHQDVVNTDEGKKKILIGLSEIQKDIETFISYFS